MVNNKLFLAGPLILISLVVILWFVLKEDSTTTVLPELQSEDASEKEVEVISTLVEPIPDNLEVVEPAQQDKEEISPGKTVFAGKVINAETSEAVKCFTIHLQGKDKNSNKPIQMEHTFQDENGRFTIPLKQGGKFRIWVIARGYLESRMKSVDVPQNQGVSGYEIRLDPGRSITGRVVLNSTGEGVPGALVEACEKSTSRDRDGYVNIRLSETGQNDRTDANGKFKVNGLNTVYFLRASHPKYGYSFVKSRAGRKDVVIRLGRGYKIYGTIRDDYGRCAHGVAVEYTDRKECFGGPVLSSPDGQFVLDSVMPGEVEVTAYVPTMGDNDIVDFTTEKKWVKIENSDVEVSFGSKPSHVKWRGTFYGWQGKVATNGKIRVTLDISRSSEISGSTFNENIMRNVTCDENGRFEIRKLIPGVYRVYLSPMGERIGYDNTPRENMLFNEPGIYNRDIHLRNTEISGVVIIEDGNSKNQYTWTSIRAFKSDKSLSYSQDLDVTGRFQFRGIQSGDYYLVVRGKAIAGANKKVTLAEGQIIDDIEIVVPINGTLHCMVTGLEGHEGTRFDVNIKSSDDKPKWNIYKHQTVKDGTWEGSMQHEIGSWKLVLEHNELGKLERAYEIFGNQTTEIAIHATEFVKK